MCVCVCVCVFLCHYFSIMNLNNSVLLQNSQFKSICYLQFLYQYLIENCQSALCISVKLYIVSMKSDALDVVKGHNMSS